LLAVAVALAIFTNSYLLLCKLKSVGLPIYRL